MAGRLAASGMKSVTDNGGVTTVPGAGTCSMTVPGGAFEALRLETSEPRPASARALVAWSTDSPNRSGTSTSVATTVVDVGSSVVEVVASNVPVWLSPGWTTPSAPACSSTRASGSGSAGAAESPSEPMAEKTRTATNPTTVTARRASDARNMADRRGASWTGGGSVRFWAGVSFRRLLAGLTVVRSSMAATEPDGGG